MSELEPVTRPVCARRSTGAAQRAGLRALALAAFIPVTTVAQNSRGSVELTPYAGYRFGGSFKNESDATTVALDDGESLGLIFNVRESANTEWEVLYARQATAADTSMLAGFAPSTDLRIETLQGGGTYEFEGRNVTPYLAATLGASRVSPQVPNLNADTFWSMSLGFGIRIRPTARIGFRLEARAMGSLVSSDTKLFCRSDLGAGACAIRVDGRVLWQVETVAGIVLRF